jgi:hypothetical protein
MAQGPLITKEVQRLIAEVYDEHPDWVSKEIQQEVHRRLKLENRPSLKKDWPSLSTIQRELAQIRKNYEETRSSPFDRPWSLGDLNTYELSTETIPVLLKIQLNEHERGNRLTIRQAKWISRLYKSITDTKVLTAWARVYSWRERISALAGQRLDTHEYDMVLASGQWDSTRFRQLAESDMPDRGKLNTGRPFANALETMLLGHSLESDLPIFDLTGQCWLFYCFYLCQLEGTQWENMTPQQKESFVRRLRDASRDLRSILSDIPNLFKEAGIRI